MTNNMIFKSLYYIFVWPMVLVFKFYKFILVECYKLSRKFIKKKYEKENIEEDKQKSIAKSPQQPNQNNYLQSNQNNNLQSNPPLQTPSQNSTPSENRIKIIEKVKVINKIECKYCGSRFNEEMPECPRCGASND